jgi:hypothetical protein
MSNKCQEGQQVTTWKKHNGRNQRWTIIYGTGMKVETKGKDSYFGLYINEPFYAFCKGG